MFTNFLSRFAMKKPIMFIFISLLMLLLSLPIFANQKVLLKFDNFVIADMKEKDAKAAKPFKDNVSINRMARQELGLIAPGPLTPEQQKKLDAKVIQVANMIMDDIKTGLEKAYEGKWISFTKDPKEAGITKTLDFPAVTKGGGELGSAKLNGDKAWILPENFEEKFWLPANKIGVPIGGVQKPEGDRNLDKAEFTNDLIHTAAHELGHLFGLVEIGPGVRIQKKPIADAKGKFLILDPKKSSIMSQGDGVFPMKFTEKQMKFLDNKIGTKDADGKKKKNPKPKKEAKIGDRDAVGTNPDKKGKNFRISPTISPFDIVNTADDPFGIDKLLEAGMTSYIVEFDVPVGGVAAAFLDLGLFGVNEVDNPGSISLFFEGVELLGAFDNFNQSPDPLNPIQFGSQVFSQFLDLEDFFTLGQLTNFFSDNSAIIGVSIAGEFDKTIAVDFVQVDVFMAPEPPIFALLIFGLVGMFGFQAINRQSNSRSLRDHQLANLKRCRA